MVEISKEAKIIILINVIAAFLYAFFFLGISFVGMGTALTAAINPGFTGITGLGIIYMIIGLKNKDKWPNKKQET